MSNVIYKQGQISDIDEKLGIVKGYGSVFGNKDSDNDIIEKGEDTLTLMNNYVDQLSTQLDKQRLKTFLRTLYTEAGDIEL